MFLLNNFNYKFLDWTLLAFASILTCQVATSMLLNSLSFALVTIAINIYIASYFNLIKINEVQLKYFIAGSMPLLLIVELHHINMPIAYLLIVYLVIYNTSFTMNYILHERHFNLIFLSLQVLALFLVGLIILNNMHLLELIDCIMAMKKNTAETFGKIVANEISKVKPPKLPDNNSLPAALDTSREEGFYKTTRSNSELEYISVEGNQSVLSRLSALSEVSSQTYSQLTDEAREAVNNKLTIQINALGGALNKETLNSPRLSDELNKLIQNALECGVNSPKVEQSAKKVAKLYCTGQENFAALRKQEILEGVGKYINKPGALQTIYCNYHNFPASILELTTEVVKQNDPNKLWNLNNLLFSLTKTTNLGDKHLCSLVSNEYLEKLAGFTKTNMLQRHPHLMDSDLIFGILAQSNPNLNPNMENSNILSYLNTVNGQRMDDNSRVLVTNSFKDWAAGLFIKKVEDLLGENANNSHIVAQLIKLGLTPSKKTIMDLYVEKNGISWNTPMDHGFILDIPTLGILQEPLIKFYSNNDTNALYHALDIVSANTTDFKVNTTVNRENFNMDVDFKWVGGETLKASFLDPDHSNGKKSNVMGLDVLVHTIVYQTTVISHQNQDIASLISKAKANPEIWDKISQSVPFRFHNQTHGNYIDHIQVAKNIKNNE